MSTIILYILYTIINHFGKMINKSVVHETLTSPTTLMLNRFKGAPA